MSGFQVMELAMGGRGLYEFPFWGPNGERVVCAWTSQRRLTSAGIVLLPPDMDTGVASNLLAAELETEDPVTDDIRRSVFRVG